MRGISVANGYGGKHGGGDNEISIKYKAMKLMNVKCILRRLEKISVMKASA